MGCSIYLDFVEPIDRLWFFFTDAARRWNCRKPTSELPSMPMAKTVKRKVNRMILELLCNQSIDVGFFFSRRCSALELSKIDFGTWSCGTNRSTLILFWDAARFWHCRKSTLEYCLLEPIDQIDFGIFYGHCSTLELSKTDFGIVEYANGQDCQEKSQ